MHSYPLRATRLAGWLSAAFAAAALTVALPASAQEKVLRIGMTAADDGIGHRAHAALIGADQLAKRPLLTRPQAREQGAVGGVIH